jgi:TolB-like protein
MKKFLLLIAIFNVTLVAYTQQLVVVVANFTGGSNYSEEEFENVTELFAGVLRETGKVRVLTRSQWKAILGEHEFQRASGLVAQGQIRDLGKALGAQAVVTGTLMKLGNSNVLNLSLLDVVSGEMLSTARR